jgi:CRP-like cAMP-binding protein
MTSKPERGLTPTAFLKHVGPGRSIRTYRDKEVIYSEESPADAVFYIQSGMVKLAITSKRRSKTAVLSVLQEGELFGEGCLGRQPERMFTAVSIGPSTITRVEKATFRRKLKQDPDFANMFISHLLFQIARFKEDLADHFLNFSERRLARILLMERGFAQKSKGGLTRRFSQRVLAEMVGTTRARVGFFMSEFRKKGYIRYNGGLEIDAEQLNAFLES